MQQNNSKYKETTDTKEIRAILSNIEIKNNEWLIWAKCKKNSLLFCDNIKFKESFHCNNFNINLKEESTRLFHFIDKIFMTSYDGQVAIILEKFNINEGILITALPHKIAYKDRRKRAREYLTIDNKEYVQILLNTNKENITKNYIKNISSHNIAEVLNFSKIGLFIVVSELTNKKMDIMSTHLFISQTSALGFKVKNGRVIHKKKISHPTRTMGALYALGVEFVP